MHHYFYIYKERKKKPKQNINNTNPCIFSIFLLILNHNYQFCDAYEGEERDKQEERWQISYTKIEVSLIFICYLTFDIKKKKIWNRNITSFKYADDDDDDIYMKQEYRWTARDENVR